jgi:peptide-methionine (S)-S-oxide reductase
LGSHSETVQVDFDPARISYEELLDVFWSGHDPAAEPFARQYRSIIFYHTDEQRELALQSREREELRLGSDVLTSIVEYSDFYLAENYHQKYFLRQEDVLMKISTP